MHPPPHPPAASYLREGAYLRGLAITSPNSTTLESFPTNGTDLTDGTAQENRDTVRIISYVMIVIYPLFMFYCQYLLYKNKRDRLIKKRSMLMIKVASTVPGFIAWLNLILSTGIGAPCWVFFTFTILVAPLSIGPQLTRAIRLWSMFKLSHLMLNAEVVNMSSVRRDPKTWAGDKAGRKSPQVGLQRQDTNMAVLNALELNRIKNISRWGMSVSIWGLLVFPTSCLLVLSMIMPSKEELLETDFDTCSTDTPLSIKYLSPANGMFVASLAISGCVLLRHSSDELGIRHEITRNILLWAVTYVTLIVLRSGGKGWMAPLIITVQQLLLSYSMIVMPCHHSANFLFFLLRNGNVSIHGMGSDGNSYAYSESYSRSASVKHNSGGSGERSVYETDLDSLLSTEHGIKKFSEHCAKEFSMENIRFWQAVNQFRENATRLELEGGKGEGSGVDDKSVGDKSVGDKSVGDKSVESVESVGASGATNHADELQDMAVVIFEEYVKAGSDMQVNVPNTMVKAVKTEIDALRVTHELFDACQIEIFNLMSRDSYQRYLASKAREGGRGSRKNSIKAVAAVKAFARRRSLSNSGGSGGGRK